MFRNSDFVHSVTADLARDLLAFLPELTLCMGIVLLLVARLFTSLNSVHLGPVALATSLVALGAAIWQWPTQGHIGPIPSAEGVAGFSGLLVFDTFGLYMRAFLLVFLCLSLCLSLVTRIPDREDSADYATLLLGGTLGMMLMASANHLLTAFVAVEMASVPSYALAGFLKGRRGGSEAALKYVVYGASAAGVMLYGISLITGTYGTGTLPAIAQAMSDSHGSLPLPVVTGTVCVLAGLGFKLAAVPFHFWCPDVFEGAAAEVGAFLSVASKAAALALTARFLFAFRGSSGDALAETSGVTLAAAWAALAGITATFGNLAALAQTNMKRLLAYSTIAHAGFLMMALTPLGPRAVGPLLYYIAVYLAMNLGAFAVVALVRNRTGSEEIDAYRGLIRRSPGLTVAMSLFLLSLLGLPPLAGFAAKFQVFWAVYETGRQSGPDAPFLRWVYFGLLALAAFNTAISAGYYLRVLRTMTLDEPAEADSIPVPMGGRLLVSLLAALVVVLGVFWNPLTSLASRASHSFRTGPEPAQVSPSNP